MRTFEQPLRLANGPLTLPRSYIWCRHTAPHNFRRFYDRAQQNGWPCYDFDSSHNPHITAPMELCALLGRIATPGA